MGERALKSASCSHGAPRNQVGVNSVKSAVYQKSVQSAMSRCDTAALKRCVWPITQFVSSPPPLPPVTSRPQPARDVAGGSWMRKSGSTRAPERACARLLTQVWCRVLRSALGGALFPAGGCLLLELGLLGG